MQKLWLLFVCFFLAAPVARAEQMYKCPDGAGGSIFRNRPCPGTAPTPMPPPPGWSANELAALCKESGRSAYEIAAARDRGVTSAHLIALMNQGPTSPARDALRPNYEAVILELYSKPHITPTGAKDGMEIMCLREHAAP